MNEYNYVIANDDDNSAEIYKIMADSDREAEKKFMIELIKNYNIWLFGAFYEYLESKGHHVYEVYSKHE